MKSSLIFIPDISGFTKFVNSTEIDHAEHIISELLEIIIDANQLNLKVAEIEGDAVLFYREDFVPTYDELFEQAKTIFINFHSHLQRYEVERVCQCGACSTASSLSIKFVSHIGEIGFTNVKNNLKPFGPNLVLAHRLLKNDIQEYEYLLFTDQMAELDGFKNGVDLTKKEVCEQIMTLPETGDLSICYVGLNGLRELIPEPVPPQPPEKIKHPVLFEIIIEKPLYYVFEMVTNLDFRLSWNNNLNELEYEKGKLNRTGTKHRCLFNTGFADFETIKDNFGSDTLVYGEQLNSAPGAKYIAIYYLLTQTEKGTRVEVQGHYKMKKPFGIFLTPFIRYSLKKGFNKSLSALKEVCESNDEIPYISSVDQIAIEND